MLPMVPMLPLPVRLPQREGCRAPSSRGDLPAQHQAGDARPRQLLEEGRKILAPTSVGVRDEANILVKVACSNGGVVVALPPNRKQVDDRLPATIPRLRFVDPLGRILTAKR